MRRVFKSENPSIQPQNRGLSEHMLGEEYLRTQFTNPIGDFTMWIPGSIFLGSIRGFPSITLLVDQKGIGISRKESMTKKILQKNQPTHKSKIVKETP